MTPKKQDETETRLRAVLCDEPVHGIDLDEHARNVAVAVTGCRAAAEAEDLAAVLRLQARKAHD